MFLYSILTLPKVLETKGQELASAFVYFTLSTAPAWAGFHSRDGEHAGRRSRALILSNVALSLFMVLWGLDAIPFPTSFMPVSWRGPKLRGFLLISLEMFTSSLSVR